MGGQDPRCPWTQPLTIYTVPVPKGVKTVQVRISMYNMPPTRAELERLDNLMQQTIRRLYLDPPPCPECDRLIDRLTKARTALRAYKATVDFYQQSPVPPAKDKAKPKP
jgi:hypothetical protein